MALLVLEAEPGPEEVGEADTESEAAAMVAAVAAAAAAAKEWLAGQDCMVCLPDQILRDSLDSLQSTLLCKDLSSLDAYQQDRDEYY